MALTVNMPQLGESVTEGTIARWLKQPGEMVSKYESIAEVITDKVNAEIPAPADGSMGEHIATEGTVVAVGEAICTIETDDQGRSNSAWAQSELEPGAAAAASDVAAAAGTADPPAQPAQPAVEAAPSAEPAEAAQPPRGQQQGALQQQEAAPAPPRREVAIEPGRSGAARHDGANGSASTAGGGDPADYHLTPAVRALVREHGVDLTKVEGSGIGGRVTKKDVLAFVQGRDAGGPTPPTPQVQAAGAVASQTTSPATAPPATAPDSQPPAAPASQRAAAVVGTGDTLVPMTPIRRSIAEHMVRSRQTSPHAWMMMETDMSAVVRLRAARKEEFRRRYGVGLTYLPFVARAVVEALQQFPTLNATWSDEGVVLKHDIHLGIAVALDDNLIVPVVRNADRLNIAGLATTMSELASRARENRLKLDEIQGGTFTLNNTGALGTVLTQAIINQPQAAILAMDAVVKRPVVLAGDAIGVRPIMNLSMSFDHRLNDGLQATRFLQAVKRTLEGLSEESALL
ncbi:MAG: dihydrolipoamide acetyltransferase family protein [Candidatus Dormibacteria bacterium]